MHKKCTKRQKGDLKNQRKENTLYEKMRIYLQTSDT